MFKNYISVSFQVVGGNFGCVYTAIRGKFTFDELKQKIAQFANDKYGCNVDLKDITITGISEISRRLYKRLTK
jgi:hypothetical protein